MTSLMKAPRKLTNHIIRYLLEHLEGASNPMVTLRDMRVINFICYCHIHGISEKATVSNIARDIGIAQSTASDAVARVVTMGVISPQIDGHDGRKTYYTHSGDYEPVADDFYWKVIDSIWSGLRMGLQDYGEMEDRGGTTGQQRLPEQGGPGPNRDRT